ncbi:MAG: response regulator transcription factor [Treponema sp.]|jgi:DNA-binding NarL/FixJ family response regulator|nr:response regulator transcription factor [Treponema sp.]
MAKTPGIIIIEDHPVMRDGLASYFNSTGRWRVMGTASNLAQAKELLTGIRPDLALLDIQLEDGWGLDIIPWLAEQALFAEQTQLAEKNQNVTAGSKAGSATLMAVYSSFDDYAHVSAAMSLGVRAYITKRRSEYELEQALLQVLEGKNWIDEKVQTSFRAFTDFSSVLTRREKEILGLVARGLSNEQIAGNLGISRRTVENILSCIYDKTGISSRLELQRL